MEKGSEVLVESLPPCDLCKIDGIEREAHYDASVKGGTAWGYLCQDHFDSHGRGLGVGVGQRLIVRPKPAERKTTARLLPVEVDFARRYFTEGEAPDVTCNEGMTGLLPPVWLWMHDGRPYSAQRETTGHYIVQWDDAEGLTCSAHVRDDGEGVFAFLMWDGPQWRVVGRARLVDGVIEELA